MTGFRDRKPHVNTCCVANNYTGPNERVIEFSSAGKPLRTGLIRFIDRPDGTLCVEVYRIAEGVEVQTRRGTEQ